MTHRARDLTGAYPLAYPPAYPLLRRWRTAFVAGAPPVASLRPSTADGG